MSGSIATRRLTPRNLLVFAIASLFSAPIFADQVVLDFGSLATPHIIPPTYTTPQFTVEKLGGSAEVRIASGTDSALWYLRNSFGWSATTSITLTEGGTFDFVSFRYESGAHLNGFRDVRGFSNGNLVATHLFETAALGTIDVSYNPAFQGIDEV